MQSGGAAPAWKAADSESAEAEAKPAGQPAATAATDEVLLELDLGENRELLKEFHSEASEHLQSIEAALLALEQRPDDPEAVNSIFRSFHTLTGNAGFLGLVPMRRLAHEVETLLDLVRTDKLRVNGNIVTGILASRDALVGAQPPGGRRPRARQAAGQDHSGPGAAH